MTQSDSTQLPVWRSMMFVPANNLRLVSKAHSRGADAVVLDLEDSVPLAEKPQARDSIGGAVSQILQTGVDVMVRINQPWRLAVRDLEAVVSEAIVAIVVPKVSGGEQINGLDELMSELEVERNLNSGQVGIIAQIETPQALTQLDLIAAHPRVIGISLGPEDFSAAVGMQPNPDTLLLPSQQIIFAARRHACIPYGFIGSIADYQDLERFRAYIKRARQFGFQGSFAIHPHQVEIMNQYYMPNSDEVEFSRRVVEGFSESKRKGSGVFSIDGKMIDKPVVDRAIQNLQLFERFT